MPSGKCRKLGETIYLKLIHLPLTPPASEAPFPEVEEVGKDHGMGPGNFDS